MTQSKENQIIEEEDTPDDEFISVFTLVGTGLVTFLAICLVVLIGAIAYFIGIKGFIISIMVAILASAIYFGIFYKHKEKTVKQSQPPNGVSGYESEDGKPDWRETPIQKHPCIHI